MATSWGVDDRTFTFIAGFVTTASEVNRRRNPMSGMF